MKRTKQSFLAMLLAVAFLFSLLPTAQAAPVATPTAPQTSNTTIIELPDVADTLPLDSLSATRSNTGFMPMALEGYTKELIIAPGFFGYQFGAANVLPVDIKLIRTRPTEPNVPAELVNTYTLTTGENLSLGQHSVYYGETTAQKYRYAISVTGSGLYLPNVTINYVTPNPNGYTSITYGLNFRQLVNTTTKIEWHGGTPADRPSLMINFGAASDDLPKTDQAKYVFRADVGDGTIGNDALFITNEADSLEKDALIDGKKEGKIGTAGNMYQYQITGNVLNGYTVKLGKVEKITFAPGDKGSFASNADVDAEGNIVKEVGQGFEVTAPTNPTPYNGFIFSKWEPTLVSPVTETKTYKAVYTGENVIEDPNSPEAPAGYKRIIFYAGNGHFGTDSTVKIKTFDVKEDLTWETFAPSVVKPTAPGTENEKNFTGWNPSLPTDGTLIKDGADQFAATYGKNIIEDPTTPNAPEGYKRITFDAGNGHFGTDSTVKTKTFDVKEDLTWETFAPSVVKPTAPGTENEKNFTGWNPNLPANDITIAAGGDQFAATYGKDIIEDPTTPTAPEGYVRLSFNAGNGHFGTDETNKTKTFDVKDTLTWETFKTAVVKPTAPGTETEKNFIGWNPTLPADAVVVKDGVKVFDATYGKDIIEDPTTPNAPEGYKRITFDAGNGHFGTDSTVKTKTFDVKEDLTWETFAPSVVKPTAPGTENEKNFTGWNPNLPANDITIAAGGDQFAATYGKDIIEDPTTPTAPEGYVRLSFNAGNGYFGLDTAKKVKTYDVKESLTWETIKPAIVKPTAPLAENEKNFIGWNPTLPANTVVAKDGAKTFDAKYAGDVIGITDPTAPTPEGFVRVAFKPSDANKGSIAPVAGSGATVQADGSILYDVKLGVVFPTEKLPTITPKTGFVVATPAWSPDVTKPVSDTNKDFSAQYLTDGLTAPTATQKDKDTITGTATVGSTVQLKDKDGNKIGDPVVVTNPDGTYELTIPADVAHDDQISVVATKDGNAPKESGKVTIDRQGPTVTDEKATGAKEDPVYEITLKATDPSGLGKATVTLDGKEYKGTIDNEGNVSIFVPRDKVQPGASVPVVVSDKLGNTTEVNVTMPSDNQTVAPVVFEATQPYARHKRIVIHYAEPQTGVTIQVTVKDAQGQDKEVAQAVTRGGGTVVNLTKELAVGDEITVVGNPGKADESLPVVMMVEDITRD